MLHTRKQWLAVILCSVFVMGLLILPSAKALDRSEAVVEVHDAALYDTDSASGVVIARLDKGVTLTVLDTGKGGFSYVIANGQKGYVKTGVFKITSVSKEFDPALRAKVLADNVNLRAKASTDSVIICTLKKGTLVEVTEETDGWYRVVSGRNSGYVFCDYVELVGATKESGYATLSMGMSSAQVSRMQQALADLGYYHGQINGSFGARTRDALKQFQQDQGLAADGVARPDTLKLLYEQQESEKKSTSR